MQLLPRIVPFGLLLVIGALISAQASTAADPPLATATGVVDKATKDSLSVKPRGADGKFQKTISLKVTGTSKVSILTPQKRGDKIILTQRDAEAKDLMTGQVVAVIFAEAGKDEHVLLAAIAQPAPGK